MAALRADPPDPVAPWAEVVPGAPYPMTVQDLLDWPDDDGYRYELVEEVLVRVAGSGDEATTIGATIVGELYAFVRPRRWGLQVPRRGNGTRSRRRLLPRRAPRPYRRSDQARPLRPGPCRRSRLALATSKRHGHQGAHLPAGGHAAGVGRVARADTGRCVAPRYLLKKRGPGRQGRRGGVAGGRLKHDAEGLPWN